MDQLATEWEHELAFHYVNYRPIVRPETNIKTAILFLLSFTMATIIISWLSFNVIMNVGIFPYFHSRVKVFYTEHPAWSIVLHCLIVILIMMAIYSKQAIIIAVKLYQHYAPEESRRSCLFMPTCSEYTIMAVRKYGVIIGLWKSYHRMIYRCVGNIYKIDYP